MDKSDCTKLYNFINGDTKDYTNICCGPSIRCDNGGYIQNLVL